MRLHAIMGPRIQERIENPGKKRTFRSAWPYQEAFHGKTDERKPPVINRYGDRPYETMSIVRNLHLTPVPEVCADGIHLVISEAVATQLGWCKSIDLVPCKCTGVYDLPIDEKGVRDVYGQFSVFTEDFSEHFKFLIRPPTDYFKNLRLFEVLAPRPDQIVSKFNCSTTISLPPTYSGIRKEMRTCPELHSAHPIVSLGSYHVLDERAWEVFEPYVRDLEMFTVIPVDI